MKEIDKVLKREEIEWRKASYQKYVDMNANVHFYTSEHNGIKYEIEIHTKKSDTSDEIIVMVEVSKKSFLGLSVGKAKYFAIDSENSVRDATPDEAF